MRFYTKSPRRTGKGFDLKTLNRADEFIGSLFKFDNVLLIQHRCAAMVFGTNVMAVFVQCGCCRSVAQLLLNIQHRKRRDLTKSQKAMVSNNIRPFYEDEAKERQKLSLGPKKKGKVQTPDLKSIKSSR